MTLTDRYIAAAVRGVPADQKADIEADIRSLILDTMEVHEGEVEDPEHLERIALEELGDPERLASTYLDRELALIGPRYFLEWKRYTKWIALLIAPIVAVGTLVGALAAGEPAWESVLDSIATTGTVAVQIIFWLTVAFAIAERTGQSWSGKWTVKDLPEPTTASLTMKDALVEVVGLGLGAGVLLWAGLTRPSVHINEARVEFFHPELNSWVLYGLAATLIVQMIVVLIRSLRARYSGVDVAASVVLNAATLALALPPLFNHTFFSTDWTADVLGEKFESVDLGMAHNVVAAVFILFGIWDVASTAYQWWKSKR